MCSERRIHCTKVRIQCNAQDVHRKWAQIRLQQKWAQNLTINEETNSNNRHTKILANNFLRFVWWKLFICLNLSNNFQFYADRFLSVTSLCKIVYYTKHIFTVYFVGFMPCKEMRNWNQSIFRSSGTNWRNQDFVQYFHNNSISIRNPSCCTSIEKMAI